MSADESLKDGRTITVRSIRPDDREALADGMQRLSPQSRYRRFFSPVDDLSKSELSYLTDVDHVNHEALVAEEPITGAGIGVARFIRLEDPQIAEVAIAVADEWQDQGVGTVLLRRLTERAREEGIRRFAADVLADNEQMLHLLNELGTVREKDRHLGSVEVQVELPEAGVGALSRTLKAAASGALKPPSRADY
jgi:RimJ/RimL family protein N-acetyltransferase